MRSVTEISVYRSLDLRHQSFSYKDCSNIDNSNQKNICLIFSSLSYYLTFPRVSGLCLPLHETYLVLDVKHCSNKTKGRNYGKRPFEVHVLEDSTSIPFQITKGKPILINLDSSQDRNQPILPPPDVNPVIFSLGILNILSLKGVDN